MKTCSSGPKPAAPRRSGADRRGHSVVLRPRSSTERRRALEQLAGLLSVGEPDPVDYRDASDSATWRLVLMAPEGTPAVPRERIRKDRAAFAAAVAGQRHRLV